jgi:hypothetical protein
MRLVSRIGHYPNVRVGAPEIAKLAQAVRIAVTRMPRGLREACVEVTPEREDRRVAVAAGTHDWANRDLSSLTLAELCQRICADG